MSIPFLFYLCLIERFDNFNKYLLLLISSLVLYFPTFQYSAIWGNNHLTAIFFFLLGTLFHLKLIKSEYKKIKYFFISIIFFAFACYTKQYYVFFFIFLFVEFLIKLKIKLFLQIAIFTFILSIPGILFLINSPLLFFGVKQETTNFSSSILISASICFFYILPFLIQYIFNNLSDFKKEFKNHNNLLILIISFLIFIPNMFFFNYSDNIGGGVFYKFFTKILDQKILFFIVSFLGIYFILFFTKKNISNYLLSTLLICSFSTGYFIFQKYFEPMFFIIFCLYFDHGKISHSIKKSNKINILYYLFYYLSINYIYFFGI